MSKKLLVLFLSIVLVLVSLPFTAFAADAVNITVTADKATAYQNDTVNFTVTLGAVSKLNSAEFKLSIPAGFTYVANSAVVTSGLKDTLGAAAADWTEASKKFTVYGDGSYTSTSNTKLLTFSCKADATANGKLSVTLSGVAFADSDYEDYAMNLTPVEVSVSAKPVAVTGVTLDKTTATVKSGATEQLTATIAPADATNKEVTWTSNNTAVATVSAAGLVTAVKEGTATITATTKDGSKTAICTVTVTCAHANLTKTEAKASTCKVKGNNEYYTCDACGKVFKADKTTVTTVAAETLPLATHKGVKTDKVDATHDDKGNIEYYTCSVCNKIFSDAACTKEIKLADTVIPALGHTASETWEVKTPATCTTKGVKVQKCTVCGEEMNTQEIPALGHTWGEWTVTKEATVTEKGERKHECSVCHEVDTEEIPMLVKEVVSADNGIAIEVTGDDTLTGYTKVTVSNVTTTDADGIEGKKIIKGIKFNIVDSDTNQAIDGTKTVKAKIKIDDISTSYKNLQVVIDGQVVDSEINTEGYIVFSATADQLAKVVLVGDEYEAGIGGANDDDTSGGDTGEATSPKTGEAATAALAVAILSAAAATVVLTKKKRA